MIRDGLKRTRRIPQIHDASSNNPRSARHGSAQYPDAAPIVLTENARDSPASVTEDTKCLAEAVNPNTLDRRFSIATLPNALAINSAPTALDVDSIFKIDFCYLSPAPEPLEPIEYGDPCGRKRNSRETGFRKT